MIEREQKEIQIIEVGWLGLYEPKDSDGKGGKYSIFPLFGTKTGNGSHTQMLPCGLKATARSKDGRLDSVILFSADRTQVALPKSGKDEVESPYGPVCVSRYRALAEEIVRDWRDEDWYIFNASPEEDFVS
jgi:hypothetical protein